MGPGHWSWPDWALNHRQPCIEVYVEDEDTTGGGRWVNATPLHRVIDKQGHDAFLSAQYDWDGELYEQDFTPEHVRRQGERNTVAKQQGIAQRPPPP